MEQENLTNDTQTSTEVNPAEVGNTAESTSSSGASALTLEEINAITGKNYTSKEAALKSIKDMNSMAGKAADLQGRKPEQSDEALARIKALELDNFYARNPQHETNREILEALAEKNGVKVEEAINLPAYQKIAGAGETRPRTVADSNNRVPVSKEKSVADVAASGNPDDMAQYIVDKFILK